MTLTDSWVAYFTTVFSHKVHMQKTSNEHLAEYTWAWYQSVMSKPKTIQKMLHFPEPWADIHI